MLRKLIPPQDCPLGLALAASRPIWAAAYPEWAAGYPEWAAGYPEWVAAYPEWVEGVVHQEERLTRPW